MMDDPTQPKPADLLAAMIDFRDAVAAQFARVDARFGDLEARMDARFDRIERRLVRMDDRMSAIEDGVQDVDVRVRTLEGRRKR